LFEARNPKGEAILADISGRVALHRDGEIQTLTLTDSRIVTDPYSLPEGYELVVSAGDTLDTGDVIARSADHELKAEHGGVVDLTDEGPVVRREVRFEESYVVPAGARLRVSEGDSVSSGQQLSEGSQNPYRILEILGVEATQGYLLEEIQKVYRTQGVTINDKHIEIIVRQMLSKVRILRPGDAKLLPGDLIERAAIEEINDKIAEDDGRPATYQPMLLGITKASLDTESVLSAASFQHTINILARAAIEGKTDMLVGLKENVILGKLIPAGTGFHHRSGTKDVLLVTEDEDLDLDLSEEALAELLEDDLDLDRLALLSETDAVLGSVGVDVTADDEVDVDDEDDEDGASEGDDADDSDDEDLEGLDDELDDLDEDAEDDDEDSDDDDDEVDLDFSSDDED
jgi:DNA-directed RNA polymerase subunit beta'